MLILENLIIQWIERTIVVKSHYLLNRTAYCAVDSKNKIVNASIGLIHYLLIIDWSKYFFVKFNLYGGSFPTRHVIFLNVACEKSNLVFFLKQGFNWIIK